VLGSSTIKKKEKKDETNWRKRERIFIKILPKITTILLLFYENLIEKYMQAKGERE
jgi:hypothetical protein